MFKLLLSGILVGIAWGDERIVGGQIANLAEFPHQVSLRFRKAHTCGGSILHPSYILTAAHCVEGRDIAEDFAIVSGTNQLLSGGEQHAVDSIVYHEKFSRSTLDHDVAIIKLQKPLIFNKYQKAIPLPKEDTPANVTCFVSGWGLTSYPGNRNANDLQKIRVKTFSNKECQRWHDYGPQGRAFGNIGNGMICAFNKEDVGTCKGDSGGPLIEYDLNGPVQIGLVSWVWRYCALGIPDVYTRIYYYLDWIHKHTDNLLF